MRFINAFLAPVWYALACEAYYKKDLQLLHEYSLVFLDLLKDLDQILQTNENFMLGPWIGNTCVKFKTF